MTNPVETNRPKIRRKQYVIDWRLQMAITAQLLGVLFGVGCLYTVGLFVLPDGDALARLAASEVAEVIMRANAIYFALGAAILGTIAILLTHRVAGPAYVVERAVQGMRKGDYGQRLTLRRRDYLKPLAAAVEQLRGDLQTQRERRLRLAADLDRCLQEGDVRAAREIVAQLGSVDGPPAPTHAPGAAADAEPAGIVS